MPEIIPVTNNHSLDFGLPRVKPEEVGMSPMRLARITERMQDYIDQWQVPGLLTAVARRGKVVHFETQGFADLENQVPLAPDSIFRLISMSKPVTAVAVMIAYEEGCFFLDDPVANYLPEFSDMKVWTDKGPVNAERPLTIRHLLTHTGGIGFYPYPDNPVSVLYRKAGLIYDKVRETMTTEEYVKKIADLPLAFQPGDKWFYSDSMEVLGRLIEVVSRHSYGNFLRNRIFSPLGMKDTDFYVPLEKTERLATLYEIGPNGRTVPAETLPPADFIERTSGVSDYTKPPMFESGGCGLVGTATDYLRFAQMLLNGGEIEGVRILSPTSVKLITSNHLGAKFEVGGGPLAAGNGFNIEGLGFGFCGRVVTDPIVAGLPGSVGEYSWGGAANTDFWLDPKQELIGMVFTQLFPHAARPTRNLMQQMTYQAIVEYYE